MNVCQVIGMLAQAEPEGNPFFGFLIIAGVIWACYAIFGPKKAKYRIERETRVTKV